MPGIANISSIAFTHIRSPHCCDCCSSWTRSRRNQSCPPGVAALHLQVTWQLSFSLKWNVKKKRKGSNMNTGHQLVREMPHRRCNARGVVTELTNSPKLEQFRRWDWNIRAFALLSRVYWGWEGPLGVILAKPLPKQGHSHTAGEDLQGWVETYLGNLCKHSVNHTKKKEQQKKKCFLTLRGKLLCANSSHLVTGHHQRGSILFLFESSPQVFTYSCTMYVNTYYKQVIFSPARLLLTLCKHFICVTFP